MQSAGNIVALRVCRAYSTRLARTGADSALARCGEYLRGRTDLAGGLTS